MKYIALKELEKHIIHDGCDEGCGYIDERDLAAIPTVDLDKMEQEQCEDKYIKEIDHLRKYICKLETQIVEQAPCEYKPLVIDKLKDEDMQKLLREFKNQQVLVAYHDCLPSVTIIKSCDNAISRNDMLDAIGHGTTYTSKELQKIINGLPEAKAERIEK